MSAKRVFDERDKRRLESINFGRKYVDGCKSCESIKARNGFGPDHDASEGCESGWYKHCSCDVCF